MSATAQAAGIHWDLDPLFPGVAEAGSAMEAAVERSRRFAADWRGRMAEITPVELAEALAELGAIDNLLSRAHSYASLRKSVDVNSEENRDLSALVEQRLVEAMNELRFFELEWLALPDDRALTLAEAPELERDRHHLIAQRRYAPHTLSEAEERIMAERSPAAVSAWQTLFSQQTSTIEVPFDGGDGEQPHTIDRLLAYVHDERRELRHSALDTLYEALEPHAAVLAHCYDSLVGDRLVVDRLRSYGGDPMLQTHLRNELDGEVVETMMAAVESNYPMARRWFDVKARLLGLERLDLADQYAPIGEARSVAYDEACAIVSSAFDGFSKRVAEIAGGFFHDRRIDAEPRAAKRGGAFCSPVAQDARPYVMMNFTDRMNDVLTLAHELGHGIHFSLSHTAQTPHSAYTGLAMAEVPSTFAEFVTFDHLLAGEQDAETRRVLVGERVEGAFATIFRQTVLARYEQRAYALRAGSTTLSAERLGELWLEENVRYYADSLALPDGYRLGWAYIPHFINTRFYTYAYVFAKLVALLLYGRYRSEADAFVEGYLELLTAGGSAEPEALLRAVGVDLRRPGVWDDAFAELDRMVTAAEAEA